MTYNKSMAKGKWTVSVNKRAYKNLPAHVLEQFHFLLKNLQNGPQVPQWPNYSKLGKITYHCHLKKGRPTYVACWAADKNNKIIEVYYVGTHEKAPY